MAKIQTEHRKDQQCDIQLPQEIIESFARFLLPEIRKYYGSERGQWEFKIWQEAQSGTEQEGKNNDVQGFSP